MIDKNRFNDNQKKLFRALVFLAKLTAAGIIFRALLWIYPDTELLQAFLADLMASILSSSGLNAANQGIFIYIGETPYAITQDCLAWKSLAAFTGLVYASTKRTLEHINFLLQGFAVIIIANIIRVFSTVFLAEKGFISFNIIHDVLWSWSLTILVLLLWGYWYAQLKDREPVFQQRIEERVKKLRRR